MMGTGRPNLRTMGTAGVMGLMWAGFTKPIAAIIRRYSIAKHGHEPQLFWFMSANTRGAIIEGVRGIGDAFIVMEECKPDPNADWEKMRADYHDAKVNLLGLVIAAAEKDPWRKDVMFLPAILTRTDAYRAVKQVRYIDSEQWDSNVSRAKLHPVWEQTTSEVQHSLEGSHNPLVADQVKEAIREEKIDTYEKLMFASARGLAIALNMTDDQIQKQLPHMIGDKLAAHIKRDGERFFEAVEKTRKKLRFVS